jgi:DNA-binding response OmpR family regulator
MKTILLVEDDARIVKAMHLRLTAQGYNVVTAADAVYAMDRAVKFVPDVAILDINLPGGSGLMVAERMRATPDTAHIPVVFVTASQRESFRQRAGELGAAFVQKPFSSTDLLEAIESRLH